MDSCEGVALISAARIWGEHLCEFLVWMIGTESQSLSQNSFFMVDVVISHALHICKPNKLIKMDTTRCQPPVNSSETSIYSSNISYSYIVISCLIFGPPKEKHQLYTNSPIMYQPNFGFLKIFS